MVGADHFSASLMTIAIDVAILYHHHDTIIMNVTSAMNARSKMITIFNSVYLAQKASRIMNASMSFQDNLIYLIIISLVIAYSYIFAFLDRSSLNTSSSFWCCFIYLQNILSSLFFRELPSPNGNLSIYFSSPSLSNLTPFWSISQSFTAI
jgi:hypothetical protein